MIEKLTGKKYYHIAFTLASPLALGSGENLNTDKDLILDSARQPYIPASSMAGAARHALESVSGADSAKIRKYLGYIKKATSYSTDVEQHDSRVIFYDAVPENSAACHIVTRDSVALDAYKTAKRGAKFDMEVLEAGVRFYTFIEQDIYDGKDDDFGGCIAELLAEQGVCFGGKTMRGYGAIRDVTVMQKEFSFQEQEGLEKWLSFDVYTEKTWDPWTGEGKDTSKDVVLKLEQAGGISIRKYTTAVKPANEIAPQPDYEQLTAHGYTDSWNNGNTRDEAPVSAVPVIPGTSWAGAFRHRMQEFGIDVNGRDSIFGYVSKVKAVSSVEEKKAAVKADKSDTKNKKRSRIRFSESRIEDAKPKILSRNAIDRFSGGTVDKALFTEKTWYGGTCELRISWHGRDGIPEPEKKALAASIADLHFGFLAVGGETSIGRGLFHVRSIDGVQINSENEKELYQIALEHIGERMK